MQVIGPFKIIGQDVQESHHKTDYKPETDVNDNKQPVQNDEPISNHNLPNNDLKSLQKHVADSIDTGDWILVIEEGTKYREINIDDRILKQKLFRQNAIEGKDAFVQDLIKDTQENPREDFTKSALGANDEFISDLITEDMSFLKSKKILEDNREHLDNLSKNLVKPENILSSDIKVNSWKCGDKNVKSSGGVIGDLLSEHYFNGDKSDKFVCEKLDCRRKCRSRVMPLRRELPKENHSR